MATMVCGEGIFLRMKGTVKDIGSGSEDRAGEGPADEKGSQGAAPAKIRRQEQ